MSNIVYGFHKPVHKFVKKSGFGVYIFRVC